MLLGTDSHTCTAGAFGEFATGIGNTDAGFVLGTGKLWLKVPPTMRFVFHGELPPYLMAKDLILAVIGDIGVDGATYRAMEFDGDGVYALNIEERMTLCNMAIEAGGKNGIIAPDQVTLDYVNARNAGQQAVHGRSRPTPGAKFMLREGLRRDEAGAGRRQAAQPGQPGERLARCKGTKLDRAYIGSCTGGKMTDFRAAASILKGKAVKIDTFVVPATTEVAAGPEDRDASTARRCEEIFLDAGAKIGDASRAPPAWAGRRTRSAGSTRPLSCISTTNRNFPGRMGHKEAQRLPGQPADRRRQRADGRHHRSAGVAGVRAMVRPLRGIGSQKGAQLIKTFCLSTLQSTTPYFQKTAGRVTQG